MWWYVMRCDACMHACMVNVEMCIVQRNILNCRWAKSMSVCRLRSGEAFGRRNDRKVAIVRIKSKFNSIKAGKMLWDNEIVAFPNKPNACDYKTHKTPHWNIHDNVRSCSSLRKNTIRVKRIRNSVLWKWFSLSLPLRRFLRAFSLVSWHSRHLISIYGGTFFLSVKILRNSLCEHTSKPFQFLLGSIRHTGKKLNIPKKRKNKGKSQTSFAFLKTTVSICRIAKFPVLNELSFPL